MGIITPWMRRIALKLNFVDKPNAAHKTHSQAIPYLGGVAIIVGILATVYGSILSQENMRDFFWLATSLYGPALFLGVVGLVDDRVALEPFPRFIAQSVAGIFTAAFLISTDTLGNPSGNLVIDVLLTILLIVGITNSINFFDNLDGGAAGTVSVVAFGIFVLSYFNGQYLVSASAISIVAAMFGFLIWNKSPAKIYMGDAGALFLGTLIASLTLRLDPDTESRVISLSIPLMLLAIPILDTSVALLSRIRRGRSIFKGGKDHLSHRLLRKGFSKRESAYILWSLAIVFTFISVIVSMRESTSIFLLILSFIFWLGLFAFFFKSADD